MENLDDNCVEYFQNRIIKIKRLKELISLQKIGELKKNDEINDFVKDNFIGVDLGEGSLKTDHRIMSIMHEWKDMFSYSPGLINGIDILISLLEKIIINPEIDILEIYRSKEWRELIDLRAPVEAILEMQCKKCNGIFFAMGVSGFLDGAGLVCNKCGDVYFKSIYDDSELPACECGGHYKDECPYCGYKDAVTVGERSRYWYFSNHRFKIGKGF